MDIKHVACEVFRTALDVMNRHHDRDISRDVTKGFKVSDYDRTAADLKLLTAAEKKACEEVIRAMDSKFNGGDRNVLTAKEFCDYEEDSARDFIDTIKDLNPDLAVSDNDLYVLFGKQLKMDAGIKSW